MEQIVNRFFIPDAAECFCRGAADRGVAMAKIKVTWERSGINQKEDQKRTIRALGLRKLGQTVEHDDNRTIRGMVLKVRHLVSVQEEA